MITAATSMKAAAQYADEARHFRDIGSPLLMRTKWLGLVICEAATLSANMGYDTALQVIERRVGGVDERDVWRTRGAV